MSRLVIVILGLSCIGATMGQVPGEDVALDLEGGVSGVVMMTRKPAQPRLLVVARDTGLASVEWWQGKSTPVGLLPRGEARGMAWCVAGEATRAQEVYALLETGVVLGFDGERSREVLRDRSVLLPDGLFHMQFADDFDRDGRVDFAIPQWGGFQLYFGTDTEPRKGPTVRHEIDVDIKLDGLDAADPEFRQKISIAAFRVVDQNGDGHPDLVFRDDDHVQFYWTGRDGQIPEQPTFELDLEQMRSELPKRRRGIIDPANLLSVLESQVRHLNRDFDADGIQDLLLRRGSKVSIYRGRFGGIDRDQAVQVLKTAGNLLAAWALDDDGDGREDLCLLLVSDISVGQVLAWLITGSSLTLDLFVYRQEAPLQFAKKPTRHRQLTIEVPSLLSLSDELEGEVDELKSGFDRVPAAGDFDGDGRRDDAIEFKQGRVLGYLDVDARPIIQEFASGWYDIVRQFDRESGGKEQLTIGLYDIVDWIPLPGRHLQQFIADRSPAFTYDLPLPEHLGDDSTGLFVVDANGDGIDDIVAATSMGGDDEGLSLRFFVRPVR